MCSLRLRSLPRVLSGQTSLIRPPEAGVFLFAPQNIVYESAKCFQCGICVRLTQQYQETFGFSFIKFDEDLNVFINNINKEQDRINNSTELYPPEEYRLDCIHCSAMPWINFTGHKEPVSGQKDSVPKFAFSKAVEIDNKLMMNVALNVNHALVDGYHVSLFSEKFQEYLNHKQ